MNDQLWLAARAFGSMKYPVPSSDDETPCFARTAADEFASWNQAHPKTASNSIHRIWSGIAHRTMIEIPHNVPYRVMGEFRAKLHIFPAGSFPFLEIAAEQDTRSPSAGKVHPRRRDHHRPSRQADCPHTAGSWPGQAPRSPA